MSAMSEESKQAILALAERFAAKEGVKLEDIQIHISPHYDPGCDHDWIPVGDNPEYCSKCGISFMRHVFTEMP